MDLVQLEQSRARVQARDWKPRTCVWELTLACNLRCIHCGSNAGQIRKNELSADQCLDVASQLADLGCELVTLSGGEPTLRDDWDEIARALVQRGVVVNMVTNGVYPIENNARGIATRAIAAGLSNIGVSIDGPRDIHDFIRGQGTFDTTIETTETFVLQGLATTVLTTVSRLNLHELPHIRDIAIHAGATQWRLQLAKPMGSMQDHRGFVLAPEHLRQLIPLLAKLKQAGRIRLAVGDSLGYYGPHDKTLRANGWRGRREAWQGCQAGMNAIGIEADGGVKGCLSLQAQLPGDRSFVEGNLRQQRLADLWFAPGVFSYNRDFSTDLLTGDCARCPRGVTCRGGARCVSSAFVQKVTEDPYCWTRVAMRDEATRPPITRHAAAAAAAMAISVGAGCGASRPVEPTGNPCVAVSCEREADGSALWESCCESRPPYPAVEYGLFPEPEPSVGPVSPEPSQDPGPGCANCDYGVPPE